MSDILELSGTGNDQVQQATTMDSFGVNQDALLQILEEQVNRSLQLLDLDVAGEYHEALHFAPELVQRESRPVDFLRIEAWHTLHAAIRIAHYWKLRKELFGERWLLPMTQTGAGALTADQVELLRTGFYALTSSPAGVLISDPSRLPKQVKNFHPAVFFYVHTVCTVEKLQTEGHTMFHVVHSHKLPQADREMIRKLRASLSMKTKNVVVARSFDPGQDHLLDYSAYRLRGLGEKIFGSAEYVIGDSLRSTLDLLGKRGVDKACIPTSMGGDYFYHRQFDEWIRTRLSIEDAMVGAPPVRNSATANAVAFRAIEGMVLVCASASTASLEGLTDDENEQSSKHLVEQEPTEYLEDPEKRRRSFCARKRNEKRRKLDDLHEQYRFLENAKSALRMDNQRLEQLLEKARMTITKHH